MKNFKGVFTALVTPFNNGKVDYNSLERLVRQQLDNGIQGFVINGTTAESPNLSASEVSEIFKKVRSWSGDRTLILGTGSNSTTKTIEETKKAQDLGADAALVVVPYYNKPPQRGLEKHFMAIAAESRLPIILYNVPGRTITALEPMTIKNIAREKGVIGIKEASGQIDLDAKIIELVGKDFIMLSGDDATYVDFLIAGGHGVISVASHLLPKEFIEWTKRVEKGDLAKAREGIKKYTKLIQLLFVEANPIPVKKALQFLGILTSAECRLPLVELEKGHADLLWTEMKSVGLL